MRRDIACAITLLKLQTIGHLSRAKLLC